MFFFLALFLFLLLPSPWDVIGGVTALVLFAGEVVFWNQRVRHRKPATGAQTMIGTSGVVVSDCRPRGQIRLDGEIWEARCKEGADAGDTVVVVGLEGLTLTVERTAPG